MNASAPAAAPRAAAIESGATLDSDALRDAASCPVREALAPLSGAWASGVVARLARGRAAVSYRLTDKGRALVPLLDALAEWATDDAPDVPRGTVRGGRRVLDRRLSRTPLL